jgi:hypothetical protein
MDGYDGLDGMELNVALLLQSLGFTDAARIVQTYGAPAVNALIREVQADRDVRNPGAVVRYRLRARFGSGRRET